LACAVPPALAELPVDVGFSVVLVGATAEKWVEVRLPGTVTMSLAWFGGMSVLRRLCRTRPLSSCGVWRYVLQDESSRRRGRGDARRKTRFPAVLTTGFERLLLLPGVRKLFPESGLRHEKPFDAMRDVGGRVVIAWSSRLPVALLNMAVVKYAVSLG
jgi:hypothetical protein